jgi:hypothetical protein
VHADRAALPEPVDAGLRSFVVGMSSAILGEVEERGRDGCGREQSRRRFDIELPDPRGGGQLSEHHRTVGVLVAASQFDAFEAGCLARTDEGTDFDESGRGAYGE